MEFEGFEGHISKENEISQKVKEVIEGEVLKATLPIREEDPLTAEYVEEVERDYKISQYLFLKWIDITFHHEKILYAGSGFDILPKFVFGEEKVFHVSLENYKEGDDKYFPLLGSGIKIIADNRQLSFDKDSFEMVLFFGLPIQTIKDQLSESVRVLKNSGLVVCDRTIINEDNLSDLFLDYEKVDVPEQFQNRGVSEAQFFVFQKPKEYKN